MNKNRLSLGAAAALLMLCASFGQAVVAQPPRDEGPRERPLPQPAPNAQPGQNVPPARAPNVAPGPNVSPGPDGQRGGVSRPSFGFVPVVPPGAPPVANVDLAELVSRVAAATGKRFFLDRRAPSRIYVNGPALDAPTYPLFLVALDANGLAAAEIEGSVLVVPVAEARQLPSKIVQDDDQNIPDDEWVTRVLTIKGNRAAQLVPILRPMLPQAAQLAAFIGGEGATESKLVIVDRYANVRRITELAEVLTR
jgi:hypothetical protein